MNIYDIMKRPLNEQLKRIHKLTYKDNLITEDFLDDIFSKFIGKKGVEPQKIDDPRKADFVSTNVEDFFNTLDSIDRPLFQQKRGSMQYQKEVESVQIALLLLGYQLPKHGVDGLFGPETAIAVNKFKKDNNIKDESLINESVMMSPIPLNGVTSNFNEKRSYENHPGVDLRASSGTPIKSPADGKVIDAEFKNNSCGGTIKIEHGGGFTSRYCHCKDIRVSPGQIIKQGELIGLSGGAAGEKGAGNSKGPHLHFELKKDDKLVDPMDYIGKTIGTYDLTQTTQMEKSYITPTMIDTIIRKLRQRDINPQDLQKYIDVSKLTGMGANFTNLEILNDDGFRAYADICNKFIKTRSSNLLNITGEMLASSARKTYKLYKKLIPPELALAQLTIEGGFSEDPNARPIKTKNPFNVGNVDSGENVSYNSVQGAIDKYYMLIASQYLSGGKTPTDLIQNFVNKEGNRYASETNYEKGLNQIVGQVNKIAQPVYANLTNNNQV